MPPEDLLDRALASMQNLSEAAETMTRLLDGAVEGLARAVQMCRVDGRVSDTHPRRPPTGHILTSKGE